MLQQPPDVAASAVELIRAIVEIGEKVVVALVGIVGATVSLWRLARARIAARSLRTHVGATQYTRADIETALSNFISPRCTVVDPSGRESFRALLDLEKPLFDVLDDLLAGRLQTHHLILLADSGMGKTTALINYYVRRLRRIRRSPTIALVSLSRPDAIDVIKSHARQESTVLLADALDEDPKAIVDHRGRVAEILEAASRFRAVVITCRSQFFLSDEEITRDTGIVRLGPVAAGESRSLEFKKLYLSPFGDTQVKHREQIFEPFFTTKDPGKGTGLGLASCRAIVQELGGEITVHSEMGVGSTFRVYLPLALDEKSSSRPGPRVQTPVGDEVVLIAEDEEPVRRIATRVLEGCGYSVLQAVDGVDALRILAERHGTVDLLFTDVIMPNLGGRELADRVRTLHPAVKILFSSGYSDDMILQDRFYAQDAALLPKPYTPAVLRSKVREILDADAVT